MSLILAGTGLLVPGCPFVRPTDQSARPLANGQEQAMQQRADPSVFKPEAHPHWFETLR